MNPVKYILMLFLLLGMHIHSQTEKLNIIGAYNYPAYSAADIRIVAIEVTGNINLIGDPDDITFIDADNNKLTGYAIDDFSFLSPDGKQAWINLPKNFNRKKIRAVLITGIPKNLKKIKLQFDGNDISDAAAIKGKYPLLPPVKKRIKHNK